MSEMPPDSVCAAFDVMAERALGGRASQNWLVRRESRTLVLRGHRAAFWQTEDEVAAAIAWRARVRLRVHELGWPAARPVGDAFQHAGVWWSLEEHLSGSVSRPEPGQHAALLADFHALGVKLTDFGGQPGRLDHLTALWDESADALIGRCDDVDDQRWLRLRLRQARALAGTVDWSGSTRVLVHGDFAAHNLLFNDGQMSGLLDFELATTDRRVVDLIHVWRCRHDDVLLAFDALAPLNEDEWRLLLVDWWSLLVTLAVVRLRSGLQPDRWELDGLRRSSVVSLQLEADYGIPHQ